MASLYPNAISHTNIKFVSIADDTPSLTAAMSQIRGGFREKANSDPSDDAITAAIQYANDVAKILRENVVQGQREEGTELKYSQLSF